MAKLTHKNLFNLYQDKLAWVDRMTNPKTLEYTGESKDEWKHAKMIIFDWYQDMRYYCEDGYPGRECFDYNDKIISAYKPYEMTSEAGITTKFPCIGLLKYRDNVYPIYNDDYGMQDFIVVDGHSITVDSFGGGIDWWYVLDKIIDKIYE